MTRKDYIAIARAIRSEREAWVEPNNNRIAPEVTQAGALTCGYIAQRLSDVMAADNPRFDRAKFLAACGVNL